MNEPYPKEKRIMRADTFDVVSQVIHEKKADSSNVFFGNYQSIASLYIECQRRLDWNANDFEVISILCKQLHIQRERCESNTAIYAEDWHYAEKLIENNLAHGKMSNLLKDKKDNSKKDGEK